MPADIKIPTVAVMNPSMEPNEETRLTFAMNNVKCRRQNARDIVEPIKTDIRWIYCQIARASVSIGIFFCFAIKSNRLPSNRPNECTRYYWINTWFESFGNGVLPLETLLAHEILWQKQPLHRYPHRPKNATKNNNKPYRLARAVDKGFATSVMPTAMHK